MAMMRVSTPLLGLLLLAAGAAAQEPGIAVTGRALGLGQTPIGNARVELEPVLSRYETGRQEMEGQGPIPAARTITSPNGRFILRAPRSGIWRIVVAADGFVPHQQILPLLEDTELLPAELPVDAGLLVRLVSSREGVPVPGARVLGEPRNRFPTAVPGTLLGGWAPVERRGVSGNDGSVRLAKAASEKLRLWVAARGAPVQQGPETLERSAVVQISPGIVVTVEVQEGGAEPLRDALVYDLAGRFVLGTTGQDGRLAVAGPARGEIGVSVVTSDGRNTLFHWKETDPSPGRPRLLEIPPPASLTGRVVDRDTLAPLPDALAWPAGDPGRWVRANADGTFRLPEGGGPAEAGLAGAAPGHASAFLSLQNGQSRSPAWLALVPTRVLPGTVVDEGNRPLAGVELWISSLDGLQAGTEAHAALTAADGVFRAPGLRTGASYLVTAALPGFAPSSMPVVIPKESSVPSLRLVLGRGRTAFGQVVDESGRPVPGARLKLIPTAAGRVVGSAPVGDEGSPRPTRTGPDGRFSLPDLPAGWFRLEIEAEGFLASARDGLQIPAAQDRANLGRLRLRRSLGLHGWAGDEDGLPLAGVEVWMIPASVRDWDDLYARGPAAVTGADGSFTLRDLPSEAGFSLDLCRAGYLPLSAILREVAREPFQAVLQRAATISGRVIAEDGGPASGASVQGWLAGEEPARTESIRPCLRGSGAALADSEGRFRLDELPPGWWNLRATAGGSRGETRERLHVRAGESAAGVEIALESGAVVSGRVLTAEGRPAPSAQVSALSEHGAVQTLSEGDGAYRLAGVHPGEWTVEATLGGGRWASRSLTIQAGDNRLDLTMDQGSARQEIRGRVFGPDGPVAGATVVAHSARTFSAADGSFRLSVEDDQDYELWAEKSGFAAASAGAAVSVAGAPVSGVEIRLSRGGAVSGRLVGLEPEELLQASVEIAITPPFVGRAAIDPQGGYRIEGVPSGEWTLTARAGNRTVREPAVLPQGTAEATVDLAFPASQEVSGWILGPAGARPSPTPTSASWRPGQWQATPTASPMAPSAFAWRTEPTGSQPAGKATSGPCRRSR